jgi:hypothetical protein
MSEEDRKTVVHEGVERFIFNKLNSSKFRAQKTEESYEEKILEKIHLNVTHNKPIHLSLPFGATKNPYLPTAPGIDWGEVLNIAYLRSYLAPIAKAYKYGVILEYISVAVFEEKVNHIPLKDSALYDKEFTKLIKFYQKYLPANFELKYSRVSDNFKKKEIERVLEIKKNELRKDWNKQSKEVISQKLFRASRNCIYDHENKNNDSILLESALGHDAFCSECWTTDASPWDKKNMITLGHNYTNGWAIHVRSTPGSSVNFWSGVGVLEKRGEEFLATVLSPLQYKDVAKKMKVEKINLFKGYTNLNGVLVLNNG